MKRCVLAIAVLVLGGVPSVRAQGLALEDIPLALAGAASAAVPAASPAAASGLPAEAPASEREWLVLVFINGRNDLASAAVEDVNEMELAGSTDKVAITVELGLMEDRGVSSRMYIEKDADASGDIISPAVKVPNADMGSWKHFVDFARWSYRKYPAKKVMAVLWNHGSGRIDIGGADNAGAELGIAYDDLTRNFIRNRQLGMALAEIGKAIGKKVDVYASDACLMQMASVAYEMKDHAEVIVGAEENVPNAGFPYDAILSALAAEPGMGAEALGALVVREFSGYYSGYGENSTLSAIRTSALPGFVKLLNDWVRAAAVPAGREGVLRAGEAALAFENGYNGNDTSYNALSRDLYDLVDLAGKSADDGSALRARGEALKKFISGRLVVANGTTPAGGEYDRARGMAVYYPRLIYDTSYDENLFAGDSLWDDFLKWKLDPSYKVR